MKNTKEVEVMDFVNEEANMNVEENQEQEVVVVKKQNKLMAKLKSLKPWQKVLLGAGALAGIGFGGKVIFDAVKGQPEILTDVIEAADEVVEA